MKQVRYYIEALLLRLILLISTIIGLDAASALFGWLGRMIGPRMGISRRVSRHLQAAMPNLSPQEQHKALVMMWDNLGRMIGEFPHIKKIGLERTVIEGQEIIDKNYKEGAGAIFICGHIGNWEMLCPTLLLQCGIAPDITYRAPNNPMVDQIITQMRSLDGALIAFAKSRAGGRGMIESAKNGRNILILIDQKYNEGLAVPFFGMDAMTNPAFVHLAQKYNLPVIPVQTIRTKGAHFIVRFHEPLKLTENNQTLPKETVIAQAHGLLEDWIRQNPGQWLWLHRRWDSAKLKIN
jgi:KDO2-lipid IV(A) lauroyltransferase